MVSLNDDTCDVLSTNARRLSAATTITDKVTASAVLERAVQLHSVMQQRFATETLPLWLSRLLTQICEMHVLTSEQADLVLEVTLTADKERLCNE